MATIEHSTLTTGELHEPKGVATAATNSIYVANGAGSGTWTPTPFASTYYRSAIGTSFVAPLTFTLMNVPSAAGTSSQFSSNGAGRLTYTGSRTFTFQMNMMLSGQASVAATIDAAIFLNGALAPEFVVSSAQTNGTNDLFSCFTPVQFELSTNDYIEVFAQCNSGDFLIEDLSLTAQGLI